MRFSWSLSLSLGLCLRQQSSCPVSVWPTFPNLNIPCSTQLFHRPELLNGWFSVTALCLSISYIKKIMHPLLPWYSGNSGTSHFESAFCFLLYRPTSLSDMYHHVSFLPAPHHHCVIVQQLRSKEEGEGREGFCPQQRGLRQLKEIMQQYGCLQRWPTAI